VLRINDFIALIVAQRVDYANNDVSLSRSTSLDLQPVVYLGGVPPDVTLPNFSDDLAVCQPYITTKVLVVKVFWTKV